jgi:hypothetical protein
MKRPAPTKPPIVHPDEFDAVLELILRKYDNVFAVEGSLDDPAPVSVNELYTTFRGKEVLNKKGKTFRDKLAVEVSRASVEWKRGLNLVYQRGGGATLLIALYFEKLLNQSWKPLGVSEKGNMSNPFLKKDATNFIKIIEDAVARGCGLDDCNNINVMVHKAEDKQRPRTEFLYIIYH